MPVTDLKALTVRELLALWASTLRELRDRAVVRTFNNPIGDIAEELVARHYGGERGSFNQKTWDVAVGDELLQVKALRRAGQETRSNLSPIRSDEGYTAVVVVIFDEDLRVERCLRIPPMRNDSPRTWPSTSRRRTSAAARDALPRPRSRVGRGIGRQAGKPERHRSP